MALAALFLVPILTSAPEGGAGTDRVTVTCVGCPLVSDRGLISLLADPNSADAVDLTLYVSNQSYALATVDISISIDGRPIIEDDFPVINQHAWNKYVIRLERGRHLLEARSRDGGVTLSRQFGMRRRAWATLDFWYYPAGSSEPTPRHFDFTLSKRRIYLL